MTETEKKTDKPSIKKYEAIGWLTVIGFVLILAIGLGLMIPNDRKPLSPGITIKIDENGYNQGENASFGADFFFKNTPITMTFTGLNTSGNYLLLQISNFLHDSRGGVLLQFTNYTEIIITFQGFDCSLILFRNGRGVIIISLIGTPVNNELDLSALT